MNDDVRAAMAAIDSYAVNHDERRQARQAIRLSNAQAVVSALAAEVYCDECASDRFDTLAAWKAEVARLQGDA